VRVLRVKRLVNKGVHWRISNFPQWIYTDQNSAHKVIRLLILYLSPLSQVVQDPWLVYVEQSSHVCYYFRVLRVHLCEALSNTESTDAQCIEFSTDESLLGRKQYCTVYLVI
jgi:hypothetical protein